MEDDAFKNPKFLSYSVIQSLFQGHCQIIAQMNSKEIPVCSCVMKTSSSTLKEVHTIPPSRGTLDVTGRILESKNISV